MNNSNKKKDSRVSRGSSGSVLTFSNPNYNIADGSIVQEPKVKIWKRLKYDKAQVNNKYFLVEKSFLLLN